MGSASINSAINNHTPFYSSTNSYSSDSLNEEANYPNFPQNDKQNASPTSNEDLAPFTSELAPSKPIFDYELAFTNYSKPNNCNLSELKESKETNLETILPLIDKENLIKNSITSQVEFNSSVSIVDTSVNDSNLNGVTLKKPVQNENQNSNNEVDFQSRITLEKLENGSSFKTKEITESQQLPYHNILQEQSDEKDVSLYSIDSVDLTMEEEAQITANPSIFKPKNKDSSDQSPDQESKSSDSDTTSPAKKITKKRKKPRKNYFAPPKKSKSKVKMKEEEEEIIPNLNSTDELDMLTKENTEKNIISLREKLYVTIVKKASDKNDEESDNSMSVDDSDDDLDYDDAPTRRGKKSRKISWNRTPQYKEFHKNQSITLGERFCSPVKPKMEQPKKSCISKKAPFNPTNSKKPKKSKPLSPITVTRVIYSKK